ncbi:MAG: hypothetical protein ACYTG5_09460 [Planctomycetota bacterium]
MRLPAAILALTSSMLLPAQEEQDWRIPFRNPQKNLAPPEDLFRELRIMQSIAPGPDSPGVSFDEEGRLVCDDLEWQRAFERMLQLRYDPGYVSMVIRESGSVLDRETAMYGAFYGPQVEHTFNLIRHIPGEPVRRIRELGYQLALEFLKVHMPSKVTGDVEEWLATKVGPAGDKGPRPGTFAHELDMVPFIALLEIGDDLDRAQVFWFMSECIRMRPDLGKAYFGYIQLPLRNSLLSENPDLAKNALELVQLIDPVERETAASELDGEDLLLWFDDVIYHVYPPIRPINQALTELHASEDLDRLVATGKELLENGTLGDPDNGELKGGSYYRGLRLLHLPEPLPKLGFAPNQVITAINGEPVTSCEDLLRVLSRLVELKKTSLMVFYVDRGEERAREFRLR